MTKPSATPPKYYAERKSLSRLCEPLTPLEIDFVSHGLILVEHSALLESQAKVAALEAALKTIADTLRMVPVDSLDNKILEIAKAALNEHD